MLKIIDNSTKRMGMRFEKRIRFLLRFISPSDLMGLEKIVLLDVPVGKSANRNLKDAWGAYFQKWGKSPASIEMYSQRIFGEKPLPLIFVVPYIATKQMVYVLFHEIGHHKRMSSHGILKERNEKFADHYAEFHYAKFLRWYCSFFPKIMRYPFKDLFVKLCLRREPYKTHFQNICKLIREKPNDPDTLLAWARTLWSYCAKPREAAKIYRQVIKMGYKVGDVYYTWARMEWDCASFSKAAELSQLALEHGATNKNVERLLKLSQQSNGDSPPKCPKMVTISKTHRAE